MTYDRLQFDRVESEEGVQAQESDQTSRSTGKFSKAKGMLKKNFDKGQKSPESDAGLAPDSKHSAHTTRFGSSKDWSNWEGTAIKQGCELRHLCARMRVYTQNHIRTISLQNTLTRQV